MKPVPSSLSRYRWRDRPTTRRAFLRHGAALLCFIAMLMIFWVPGRVAYANPIGLFDTPHDQHIYIIYKTTHPETFIALNLFINGKPFPGDLWNVQREDLLCTRNQCHITFGYGIFSYGLSDLKSLEDDAIVTPSPDYEVVIHLERATLTSGRLTEPQLYYDDWLVTVYDTHLEVTEVPFYYYLREPFTIFMRALTLTLIVELSLAALFLGVLRVPGLFLAKTLGLIALTNVFSVLVVQFFFLWWLRDSAIVGVSMFITALVLGPYLPRLTHEHTPVLLQRRRLSQLTLITLITVSLILFSGVPSINIVSAEVFAVSYETWILSRVTKGYLSQGQVLSMVVLMNLLSFVAGILILGIM
ncbi:hypothetical protein [Candidatus Chloroploca mongolica]|nr:hypothetical protein [Candidatus Chloroploca mongolica]